MAGNRKLPFGYRMEFGAVRIHPLEAEIVRDIFRQYVSGASYKTLVDELRDCEIPYDHGKLWNKNMVARILENRKYIGHQGWPPIITEDMFNRVGEKRSVKNTVPQKTEAQKLLRRLSGRNHANGLEKTVLGLLNQLIASPQQITVPQAASPDPDRVNNLQQMLEREMAQQPVNEETVKRLIMELASVRYDTISSHEYETERLRRLFQKSTPLEELDAGLLRTTVSMIRIHGSKIEIQLKNGQIFERM